MGGQGGAEDAATAGAAGEVALFPIGAPQPWIGTVGKTDTKVEFLLKHEADGTIVGVVTVFDPVSGNAIRSGRLEGSVDGRRVAWTTTEAGLDVEGEFSRTRFEGVITFAGAPHLDVPSKSFPLSLQVRK
jgi:hypothetical protein